MHHTIRIALASALFFVTTTASAQPANFKPCPFAPAELQTAFGVKFEAGREGAPLKASTVTMHSCRYESKNYTVLVQSQVYQNAADAKKTTMPLAGKMVPIPNDPDGAVYQEGQGDLTDPAVHYARGSVAMHLRIMGIYYKDSASKKKDLLTMREKLAKLRRVP